MLDLKTRADLQRLIDENLCESLTLDYKASPALNRNNDGRTELVKDVTAFANSAGGQIIYGIPEVNGVPQPLDDGVDRAQRQNGLIR
jgi:predicted HTH transcriptional regulator